MVLWAFPSGKCGEWGQMFILPMIFGFIGFLSQFLTPEILLLLE